MLGMLYAARFALYWCVDIGSNLYGLVMLTHWYWRGCAVDQTSILGDKPDVD